MTGMVIARVYDFAFRNEFWFECAWFVFQYKSMKEITDSRLMALWMGGRVEFSMMPVMGGMGVVTVYITPLVIGEQPKPDTFGFWGFCAFGLMLAFILTYHMNTWLVRIGWKHGMA